jgi:hypothetical protein
MNKAYALPTSADSSAALAPCRRSYRNDVKVSGNARVKPARFGVANLDRLCTWNARFEVLNTGVAEDSDLVGHYTVLIGKQLPLHLLQLKVQATTWNIRQQ